MWRRKYDDVYLQFAWAREREKIYVITELYREGTKHTFFGLEESNFMLVGQEPLRLICNDILQILWEVARMGTLSLWATLGKHEILQKIDGLGAYCP